MNPTQDNSETPSPPHLLQHLVLLVEELHLDVSTDRKWLRELKQHQFVFPAGVGGVRGVDLHLELVHDKLGVCGGAQGHPLIQPKSKRRRTYCSRLTAGASGEHGDGFEQHLVEEQSHRFVLQLVLQQEVVVDNVAPLARDGHTLNINRSIVRSGYIRGFQRPHRPPLQTEFIHSVTLILVRVAGAPRELPDGPPGRGRADTDNHSHLCTV